MSTESVAEPNKPAEKAIRLLRPSIVVLCGPAACGKSTFAERHFRSTQIISSDWARARVCDDERDQRFQAQAFDLVHFLIEQRLDLNRLCVVDSTALTAPARNDLLDLARKHKVPCVLLLFDVPLEKCAEHDEKRERKVGRPVIERQYQLFEQAKAGLRQEGFEQVVELRDEDLEGVQIEIVFRPVAHGATSPVRPAQAPPRRGPRPTPIPMPSGPGVVRDLRPSAQGRPAAVGPPPVPSATRSAASGASPSAPATSAQPASSATVAAPQPPATPTTPPGDAPASPAPDSGGSQEPGKA